MPRSSSAKDHAGSPTTPSTNSRAQEEKASAQQAATSVHAIEPEDPKLTGRSQQREVLIQGTEGGHAEAHPESPAGQHATGSFTGETSKHSHEK
ncbi:MAG: hypothetical protein WA476_17335 [Acidobacteriaceae bacterium]